MTLLLCLVLLQQPTPASRQGGRAHRNGPVINDVIRKADRSPYEMLDGMFRAFEGKMLVPGYLSSNKVEIQGDMTFRLPASKSEDAAAQSSFDIIIDGQFRPNGQYHYKIEGDLGALELMHNQKRSLTVSHDFRSFSDVPQRARSQSANFMQFQTYILSHLNPLKKTILDSGHYRYAYGGTGNYQGRIVNIVRVFQPSSKQKVKKGPIPIKKLWTFWHSGGYEIAIYADNNMPAVVYYTNVEDNIFANFSFDYDRNHRPVRLNFQNNSIGFEGNGQVDFALDGTGMAQGVRIQFESEKGHDFSFDGTMAFLKDDDRRTIRILPPFGYNKVNRDHLKLLITTQIAGGLLNLKRHGVNIKNFKF